jgi:hypothetical protein
MEALCSIRLSTPSNEVALLHTSTGAAVARAAVSHAEGRHPTEAADHLPLSDVIAWASRKARVVDR